MLVMTVVMVISDRWWENEFYISVFCNSHCLCIDLPPRKLIDGISESVWTDLAVDRLYFVIISAFRPITEPIVPSWIIEWSLLPSRELSFCGQ